jgi:hypothetical protein
MASGARARIAAIAALVLPGLVGVVGTAPPARADAPVFLSPATGAVLSGVVEVRVQTSAPFVSFDAVYGGPTVVATAGGVATWRWETYGHPNGSIAVHAVACTDVPAAGSRCEGGSASLAVVLDNAVPVLTWPAVATVISGLVTFRATAPEGGVLFVMSGNCEGGADNEAPYEATVDTADCDEGAWRLTAVRCSTALSYCGGPESSPVPVTVMNLHPAVVSQSRMAIDPVRAQPRDTVRWTYRLGRTQYVRWRILVGDDVVRDWTLLGLQSKGDHVIAWAGRDDNGAPVPQGTYILEIRTRAGELYGRTTASIQALTSPPRVRVLASTPTGIYPMRDGFRDLFRPHAGYRYGVRFTLVVSDDAGRAVRTIRSPRWERTPSWNGRDAAGRRVPAGQYRWRLRVEDRAGHVARSSWRTLRLSYRRTELVSLRKTLPASSLSSSFGAGCSVPGVSSFGTSGLLLVNTCEELGDAVGARYRFEFPRALGFGRVSVHVYARGQGGDSVRMDVSVRTRLGHPITYGHARVLEPMWYPAGARAAFFPGGTPLVSIALLPTDVGQAVLDLRSIRLSVRAYVWAD